MPDGVDPAMKRVETTHPDPVADPVGTEPEVQELVPRHDPVLTPGKRRDRAINGSR
jgi:hypothetical protein